MTLKIKQFIHDANITHNNKYDYSLVDFKTGEDYIKIICPTHGIFIQNVYEHRYGSGCQKCSGRNKTKEDFIIEFNKKYNNKYDYRKFEYDGKNKESIVTCPKHGDFLIDPNRHLAGKGCTKCGRKQLTLEDVIKDFEKIHKDRYTYNNFVYKNLQTKSYITCREHGDFLIRPNHHLRGNGCPKCKTSKGENHIENICIENNLKFKRQYIDKKCKYIQALRFDFAIFYEDYLLFLIEFQGKQHYEPTIFRNMNKEKSIIAFEECVMRDNIKRKFCEENNIKLLEIKYDQLKDSKNIILNFYNNLIEKF